MKRKVIDFIFAALVSVCFFYNIDTFLGIEDNTFDPNIFYSMKSIEIAIVTFAIYSLYMKKDKKATKGHIILSIIFSIFMILGECYQTYGSMHLIVKNIGTFGYSIAKCVAYVYLFINMFYWIDKLVYKKFKKKAFKIKNKYIKKYLYYFNKYPFRTSWISIMIILAIFMIAYYPIVLSPDPAYQIKMYFNEHTKYIDWVIQRDSSVNMTAHHPVLQTYLLGFAIEIGRFLIDDNFGLFIYTFFQVMIYSSVLAYTIKFACLEGISEKHRLFLLGIYMFVPMFAYYSVSAVKDTLYTAFMILFVLKIYEMVKYKDKKFNKKYFIILYFIMLLLGLFRHNGTYIIILTLPFLLFIKKNNRVAILLSFLVFFGSIYTFNKVLVPALGISDGSPREMLSIPFQQTARLVKYHPEFYSEEDIEIIDYILDYDTLATRYKATLADNVKNEYNKYTTKEDLIKYFKVWFKGLIKYPDIYIDATLNNIYGYLYPDTHYWYIYGVYNDLVTENDLVDYHYNKLVYLRNTLDVEANIFPYIPIIGLVSNIAFNTWVVLILTYYLSKKYKKYIITLVPLYGTIIFCLIGPANTYFRYTMPYIFVLPVLIMLLLNVVRGVSNEEK